MRFLFLLVLFWLDNFGILRFEDGHSQVQIIPHPAPGDASEDTAMSIKTSV